MTISTYKETFQDVHTETKFDFMTAIYVFPAFLLEDLDIVTRKIHLMLKPGGKFILTVSNEEYLKDKLKAEKDLSIETRTITYDSNTYQEVLHYADIPKIGKVVDYNREEAFYIDLFQNNGFKMTQRENLNDNGFICTLFVFEKAT